MDEKWVKKWDIGPASMSATQTGIENSRTSPEHLQVTLGTDGETAKPTCAACYHHILGTETYPSPYLNGIHYCRVATSIVTGEVAPLPCLDMRRHETLCGYEGRLFKPKATPSTYVEPLDSTESSTAHP